MKVTLAHKIRIHLTPELITYFRKAVGCARVAYNWGLAEWKTQYDCGLKPNGRKLRTQFNQIKKIDYNWVYESPKDANQRPFDDLQSAFNNFFAGRTKFPKFKKKGINDSFYLSNDKFAIEGDKLRLPLFGWVKLYEPLRFVGKIMGATISHQAGQWFMAIQVELEDYLRTRTGSGEIALDFGLESVYTDQEGNKVKPLSVSPKERRLRRYQRRMNRCQKGSSNRTKMRAKVQKLHKQIADRTKDFNHKLSKKIVEENQFVYIEDLDIRSWQKLFGKSVKRNCIGDLRRMINYKAKLYDTTIVEIDKWFPSSKMCHKTGESLKDLKLSDRVIIHYDGTETDRDQNAAINIMNEGRRMIGMANPEFTPLEIEPLVPVVLEEVLS